MSNTDRLSRTTLSQTHLICTRIYNRFDRISHLLTHHMVHYAQCLHVIGQTTVRS